MAAIVVVVAAVVSAALLVGAQVPGLNVVVDLSHWNGRVDLAKAKNDGIQGVMHKATQGLAYVDPQYAARKSQALSLGIKWGAYHFANGSSGVDQAKFYLKVVGDDPNTLLALDLEENPSGPTVDLAIAEDFVKTVYETTGRYPLIYGSKFFLSNMVSGSKSILLDAPLWFARWADHADVPANTWANWTMWQYTDGKSGPEPHTVDGIGACDRDTINTAIHPSIESLWNCGRPHREVDVTTRVPSTTWATRTTRPSTHHHSTGTHDQTGTSTPRHSVVHSTMHPRTTDRPT